MRRESTEITEIEAESIRQRMREIRSALPDDVDDARQRVQQLTDWKYHVGKRPLAALTVAVVVGYLIVPAKRPRESDRKTLESEARPPITQGMFGGLVSTLLTLAVKRGTSLALDRLANSITEKKS